MRPSPSRQLPVRPLSLYIYVWLQPRKLFAAMATVLTRRVCNSTRYICARRALHATSIGEFLPSKFPRMLNRLNILDKDRLKRLNDIYSFTSLHIEGRPRHSGIQIRNTVWTNMFALSKTTEQLEKVVELMPKWTNAKRAFDSQNSEAFVSEWKNISIPTLILASLTTHQTQKNDATSSIAPISLFAFLDIMPNIIFLLLSPGLANFFIHFIPDIRSPTQ
jgi:hypothetical protein